MCWIKSDHKIKIKTNEWHISVGIFTLNNVYRNIWRNDDLSSQKEGDRGRVYLIDDDSDVRTQVGALLRLLDYDVRTFVDAAAFLDNVTVEYPAVIILDMSMPGMNGLQVHKRLVEAGSLATILYLSGNSERQDIIEAMKAGAVDFLWKPVSRDTLAEAVSAAMDRSRISAMRAARASRMRDGLAQLSTREREVYSLMVIGLPNRQIASRLGIRADTVKKYRTVICEKFMVEDTAMLIELSRDISIGGEQAPHAEHLGKIPG